MSSNGIQTIYSPQAQRAITSEPSERVIGEVEVEQHGRQDGEDRSRGLCRWFNQAAVTHQWRLGCEQQQLLQDLDPYDLVHLSPARRVRLFAFFTFAVAFPSPLG